MRVAQLKDADHPATDGRRSLGATSITDSGSREEHVFVVSRASDGPWRVQVVQCPLRRRGESHAEPRRRDWGGTRRAHVVRRTSGTAAVSLGGEPT
jgi:hypothetical protein